MPTAACRPSSRGRPLTAGVLAAAALLSACSSGTPATAPDFANLGSAMRVTVAPSRLFLRNPGRSKTLTVTVEDSGVITARSSNPTCARVDPETARSTKPARSLAYLAEFTVTPVGRGGCTITVKYMKGNDLTVTDIPVTVSASFIAFFNDRDNGRQEIYVMDADGQYQTRLTYNEASDAWPAWSPDGAKIAFASDRHDTDHHSHDIYVMDADGQNPIRLTNTIATQPAWSPDGTKIAFGSYRDGNPEIYVMDADGKNQTRLTNNSAFDATPSWSPDGTRIAFTSNRDDFNHEIYVMDADGQNQTRLTNTSAFEAAASWSPSGRRIAFVSGWEIYVMDPDGQNPSRFTNDSYQDEQPAWSPDGMKIAFDTNDGTGGAQIYVMDADGQNQTPLTNGALVSGNSNGPDWR